MNVKSAIRVFEVLEFFDEVQRDASLSDIARRLGYPVSSTSMLLQSMVDAGYLVQGEKRVYRPTPRVTLLGSWVSPMLSPDGPVISMMQWVGSQCGQTVVLATPERAKVRYIRVVPATSTVRMHVTPGSVRPFPTSGFGRLFMSQMSEDEVDEIIKLYNAHLADGQARLNPAEVRKDLLGIRQAGCSVSVDRVSPGAGVVAVHVPTLLHESPLAVGIGGPSHLIRDNASSFSKLLKNAVRTSCVCQPRAAKRRAATAGLA